LFPDEEQSQDNAQTIMTRIAHTKLRAIVKCVEICFDPDDMTTLIQQDGLVMEQYHQFEQELAECAEAEIENADSHSKWVIRLEMDAEEMLDRNITMDDVHFAIQTGYRGQVHCVFSDYNDENLVFRLRLSEMLSAKKKGVPKTNPLDQSDEIYLLKGFQDNLLDNLVLRGIRGISKVMPRKITDSLIEVDGKYEKHETWVLDTVGTNLLDLLALDYIDVNRTFTNDIQEIYRTLGIEAARQAIFNEIQEVLAFDSTYINYHHLSILCDRMTCNDSMVSIFRHGINNDDIGPIAKASFEETPEMFLRAARHAELDPMRGISANVMCGQEGYFGTSAFQVVLDTNRMSELAAEAWKAHDTAAAIASGFEGLSNTDDPCSVANLTVEDTVLGMPVADLGDENDYNPGF
jgi:DNA-directed RNA polymerase II subunit RPB1